MQGAHSGPATVGTGGDADGVWASHNLRQRAEFEEFRVRTEFLRRTGNRHRRVVSVNAEDAGAV